MAAKKAAKKQADDGEVAAGTRWRPKWRILVFMATETESLIEAAKADLLELLSARNPPEIDTRVQVHGYQVEAPHGQGSRCYTVADGRLVPGCPPPPAVGKALAPFAYGGSGRALAEFVRSHLADKAKLVLILWGHAQGVADAIRGGQPGRRREAEAFQVRPVTYAGISNTALVKTLRNVLGEATIPLVVFDSCFMAAAEVVAQFKGVADYLVASQMTVGMPALQLASVIEAARDAGTADALGRRIVAQAHTATSAVSSLTLFKPADLKAFHDLATALRAGIAVPHVARRVFEVFQDTRFREVRQFLDLVNLARRLSRFPKNHDAEKKIAEKAKTLAEALQPAPNGFVVEVCDKMPRYGGVSVYCPWFVASREDTRRNVGDAVVDDGDYLDHDLVEKVWGPLMLALRHAFRIGREHGAADCAPECQCPCCGHEHVHGAAGDGRAVRSGGPKEPQLGAKDEED